MVKNASSGAFAPTPSYRSFKSIKEACLQDFIAEATERGGKVTSQLKAASHVKRGFALLSECTKLSKTFTQSRGEWKRKQEAIEDLFDWHAQASSTILTYVEERLAAVQSSDATKSSQALVQDIRAALQTKLSKM